MMKRIAGLVLVAALGVALQTGSAAPAAGDPPSEGSVETAPPGSGYRSVSPVRVLDTRTGLGTGGATTPVGPAGTIVLDLSTRVPASATAVVLNVTGTAPTAPTFVTLYPEWAGRPTVSSLNLMAGETRPNLVTVAVGSARKVALYNNAGFVHLIADFAGYYALDGNDARDKFAALSPSRVLDTRVASGTRPPGPVGAGGVETIDLSGRVPASATAVTLNLTGTGATTGTYVTAWPTGSPRPTVSNLNLVAGATTPNLVQVSLGADRKVSLYNNAGNVDLIADLSGFYTADYGFSFYPVTPHRVLDTRDGTGGVTGPVGPAGEIEIRPYTALTAESLVLNVTATLPSTNTYVTVWPGQELRPLASNLNLASGQTASNLVVSRVGAAGSVSMYNNAGTVHLVADLAGYFALPYLQCTLGCVQAWGSNDLGQLGTGSRWPDSAQPQPVYGLSQVEAVSGDIVSGYALRDDGTVWAWGDNSRGELGNGWTGDNLTMPVPVVGLTEVTAIDGSVALRADGTVWSWGRVPSGGSDRPGQVAGLNGITAVAAGFGTGYALRADGTVWAWGYNTRGALGSGTDDSYS